MGWSAVVGGLVGMSQSRRASKDARRARDLQERMLERQIAELKAGRAEAEPILQAMLAASKQKFGQWSKDQEASQNQQRAWMSGAQGAAQQSMIDANKAAMDQATAASMGTGRFGSVLANQMRAGLAGQTGRANTELAAMFGNQMAGLEAQQQGNRLALGQAGLASEQGVQSDLVNLIMQSSGAQAGAMGDIQYQAAPQGPNLFTSMMAAAGQAGGWDKMFGGADDWLSGLFGGGQTTYDEDDAFGEGKWY